MIENRVEDNLINSENPTSHKGSGRNPIHPIRTVKFPATIPMIKGFLRAIAG
jgi:hypothetical protein